jgi:hypothetical protein
MPDIDDDVSRIDFERIPRPNNLVVRENLTKDSDSDYVIIMEDRTGMRRDLYELVCHM